MAELRVVSSGIQIGDDVSESFNGDTYPVGKVEKIFKKYVVADGKKYSLKLMERTLRIEDAEGKWVGSEDALKECYKGVNSPFWLIKGTFSEQNPSF